jgi:hypothetical protein
VSGLVGDLAFGTLIGEQALRLTVLAFIVQRFRARLRFFPRGNRVSRCSHCCSERPGDRHTAVLPGWR